MHRFRGYISRTAIIFAMSLLVASHACPVNTPPKRSALELSKNARELFDKRDYEGALTTALSADAILQSGSGFDLADRVKSRRFISEIYLKKESFAEAESYARQTQNQILESSPTGEMVRELFKSRAVLVKALCLQGKHVEVIKLVNEVARTPKDQLVGYELETGTIFSTGQDSAAALKDYESAIRFTRLQLELETTAANEKQEDAEIAILRKRAVVRSRQLLGSLLFNNGEHDEAIRVLTSAASEGTQLGLVAW